MTEETQKYLEHLKLQISLNGLGCCVGCGITPEAFDKVLQAERERLVNAIEQMKPNVDKMTHDLKGQCDFERINTINDILNLINPPSN